MADDVRPVSSPGERPVWTMRVNDFLSLLITNSERISRFGIHEPRVADVVDQWLLASPPDPLQVGIAVSTTFVEPGRYSLTVTAEELREQGNLAKSRTVASYV